LDRTQHGKLHMEHHTSYFGEQLDGSPSFLAKVAVRLSDDDDELPVGALSLDVEREHPRVDSCTATALLPGSPHQRFRECEAQCGHRATLSPRVSCGCCP
jgi:hypothetical protein